MADFTEDDGLYVSRRWRIAGGNGEKLDDLFWLATRLSGSADAFLDTLLKASRYSDGWRITHLLAAASDEVKRRLDLASRNTDLSSIATLSDIHAEYRLKVGEEALREPDRPRKIVADSLGSLPPRNDVRLWAVLQLPYSEYGPYSAMSFQSRQSTREQKPTGPQTPADHQPLTILVNEQFELYLQQTAKQRADEYKRVLHELESKQNIGGYVPGLTSLAEKQVRSDIRALADLYIKELDESSTRYDAGIENAFRSSARQVAGGSLSGLLGQLDRLQLRRRIDLNYRAQLGYIRKQIADACNYTIKECRNRLRRQALKTKNTGAPLRVPSPPEPTKPPPQPAIGGDLPKSIGRRDPRKKTRRNPRYEKIDAALIAISEALPKDHEEVFQSLNDRNVPIPRRKPFKLACGWLAGFRRDRVAASAWLSQAWARLGLPAFARGPKK
jgi:hypothetical protein